MIKIDQAILNITRGEIWCFVADQNLSDEQNQFINQSLSNFFSQWSAHGTPLTAIAQQVQNRIWLVATDYSNSLATGCSKDKLFQFMENIGREIGVDLFDRSSCCILHPVNNNWTWLSYEELERQLNEAELPLTTTIINTAMLNIDQLKNSFVLPVSETWIAKRVKV